MHRALLYSFGFFAINAPCCAGLYRYELQLVGKQHVPSICHAITVLQAGSEPRQLAVACHGSLQVHVAVRQMCWGVQFCCMNVSQLHMQNAIRRCICWSLQVYAVQVSTNSSTDGSLYSVSLQHMYEVVI